MKRTVQIFDDLHQPQYAPFSLSISILESTLETFVLVSIFWPGKWCTSTCNLYMMYTIVELCDFHCTCNSLTFVLQASSHCVTKLWVLGKSQRWFQAVCVVLAFDNPMITFATIWSHHDHIFDSATMTLQQQNQLAKVHTNVPKVVWNKLKQYGAEYFSLW